MTPRRQCSRCQVRRPEAGFVSARGRLCSVCRNEAKRKARTASRARSVKSTYGLSVEDYEALWTEQGGKCGCGHPLVRQPRRVDVDHDHELERAGVSPRLTVRGLMHPACNRKVLVYARNDAERLRNLADYLDDPPGRRVLR